MSATRQSQQSPPSTESRSSSKASWAAKKSPALKSRTPAPKPGGKWSGGTPATLYQRVVACAPPGGAVRPAGGTAPGRTGRLLAPVALDLDRDPAGGMARGQRYGDLEHAVFVARGDLLGIDPAGTVRLRSGVGPRPVGGVRVSRPRAPHRSAGGHASVRRSPAPARSC